MITPTHTAASVHGKTKYDLKSRKTPGFPITELDEVALTQIVTQYAVHTVLEFGPGRSTKVFLRLGCLIDTYECNRQWFNHYQTIFYNDKRVQFHWFGLGDYPIKDETPGKQWDIAFIDAPPGQYSSVSRLNSALFAFPRSRLLAIHDSKRVRERQLIAVLKDLGCSVLAWFDTERGICLLEPPLGQGIKVGVN